MMLVAVSALAVVLCAILLAAERAIVSSMHTVTTDAAEMTPLLTVQIGAFLVLSVVGIICACRGEKHAGQAGKTHARKAEEGSDAKRGAQAPVASAASKPAMPAFAPAIAAAFFLLVACFVVRFAFYAMYMTAGI